MRGKLALVLLALLAVLLAGCTQMSAEDIAKKVEEKYNSIKDFKGTLRVTM
jgi:outer membrane lipoprotein-sorting protein